MRHLIQFYIVFHEFVLGCLPRLGANGAAELGVAVGVAVASWLAKKRQFFKFRDGTQVFSRDFLIRKIVTRIRVLTKP